MTVPTSTPPVYGMWARVPTIRVVFTPPPPTLELGVALLTSVSLPPPLRLHGSHAGVGLFTGVFVFFVPTFVFNILHVLINICSFHIKNSASAGNY